MTRHASTFLSIAGLAALVAGTALAHGGPGVPGGFGGRGPAVDDGGLRRAGRPNGLLQRLVFPCAAACGDTAKSCQDTADTAAETCVTGACQTQIDAAQTACADDARSDGCRTAIGDLRDCAADCLDTRGAAIDDCRSALEDCVDACDAGDSTDQ